MSEAVNAAVVQEKATLRHAARALRKKLDIVSLSQEVRGQLSTWKIFQSASTVATYHPMPGELDLLPLIEAFPSKTWLLPRVGNPARGEDPGLLFFHRYQPGDPLEIHPFGMAEPLPDVPVWAVQSHPPDLILVPGLMFDTAGSRLGYGKGYYDRLLALLAEAPTRFVGVAPQALVTGALPRESWDRPVQAVVTENRHWLT